MSITAFVYTIHFLTLGIVNYIRAIVLYLLEMGVDALALLISSPHLLIVQYELITIQ